MASVSQPALSRGLLRLCGRRFAKPPPDPAVRGRRGYAAQGMSLAACGKTRDLGLHRREPGGRKKCWIKRWLHRLSHRPAMRAGDRVFKRRPPLFSTSTKYAVAPLLGRRLLFRLQSSRNPPLSRRFCWLRCGSFALKSRFLEV